jgi:hypothetical protein
MHILNNENKGIREATQWKAFWKGKENIRHGFSRARAKGGTPESRRIKRLIEKAVGFWLVLGGRSIEMSFTNRMSIVYRYWRRGGHAYGDRRKTPRNDHE